MKIFALLCLIGFAAATTEWKWESGKEYRFEYSGRLLTGIPSLASQYSGLGINSTISVDVQDPMHLSLRIQEPMFVKINDVLEPVEDNIPSTYEGTNWRRLRLPQMESVPEEYQSILAKPVVIELAPNGEVSKITISKDEPEWSINYKKGIVTLFQTKLDSTSFELEENRLQNPSSESRSYWKVREETVSGRCEASYQVNEIPEYIVKENPYLIPYPEACEERKYFEVIRTIDYERCEKLASFTYYRPGHFMCGGSGENINQCGNMMTRSSSTRYFACGPRSASSGPTRGRLVIQTIVNDGEFTFKLMGTRTEKMVSGSMQTLRLKEIRSSGSFPQPSNPVTIETLMYEYSKETYGYSASNSLPEQLMPKGRIPRSEIYNAKVLSKTFPRTFFQGLKPEAIPSHQDYTEEIKRLFVEILNVIRAKSGSLSEAQVNMKQLSAVRGLTTLRNVEEVSQMYQTLVSQVSGEEKKTMEQLFYDTIVMTGTPQAFEWVEKMIREQQMPRTEMNNFFMWLPHYVMIPTEKVLGRLFKLVTETEYISKYPTTYSVAITGFTQLVQSACLSEDRKTAYPTPVFGEFCNPESEIVQEKLIPYLVRELHNSGPEEENRKNIHIIALGLLSHKTVITELTPIVEGTEEVASTRIEESIQGTKSTLSRLLATFSLGNIGRSNPNLVTPVLLSVFTNPSESTEMRVVAFNTLLKLNPPMHVFHTIASTTQNEPSMDYELLKTINIALYTLGHQIPADRLTEKTIDLITKCKATYVIVKKTYGVIPSTGTWYKTEFLRDLGVGYQGYLTWITGQHSVMPQNAYISISYFLERYYLNTFQMGYRLIGSDSLLDKISSVLSESGLRGSEPEIKEEIRRGLGNEWKNIVEKLNLKIRESEELSGSFFFRLFDSGIFYKGFADRTADLLHERIVKVLREPRSVLSAEDMRLNVQKTFDVSPIEMLVPSDMGFPINVEFHAPITVSLIGQADVRPETMVPSFSVTGKALFTNQVTGWVGTVCPFTKEYVVTGIDQHSVINLPGTLEVKLDIPSQKFSVFFKKPEANGLTDIFHYENMPYTVHEKINRLVPITKSSNLKPIKSTSPMKKLDFGLGEYLGLGLKAHVRTESRFVDFRSLLELLRIYKNPVNMMLFAWTSPALSEQLTPTIRSHKFTIRYDPSESSTRELGVEFKVGYASKVEEEEAIKYHSLKVSESVRATAYEQTISSPSVSSILKSVMPYRVESENIESVSVHPRRKEMLFKVMKQLEAEEVSGFTVSCNLIVKGNRPRTFTYSMTAALGQQEEQNKKLKQKWNLRLETPRSETEFKKICINGELSMPILPMWNINELRTSLVDFRFQNKIGLGSSSCEESKIVTSGNARVSHKQKTFSRESPEAKECQKLIEQGIRGSLTSPVCEKVRLQASSLDEIDFKTEYMSVPRTIKRAEQTILSYLKAYLWPYYIPYRSEVFPRPAESTTYSTLTRLHFKRHTPSFDMSITSQDEVITFKDIHIKYPFAMFFPLKATGNNIRLGLEKVGAPVGHTCKVDSKTVTSYDNKTLSFTPGKCFHMLTADCSKYHRFGVTTRSLEGQKKEVKVFLKNIVIEILPFSSSLNGPKVVVNGEEKTIPVAKTIKVPGLVGPVSKIIATITRTVDGVIIVKSPELLLDELRTNGKLIEILPSPLLKNKMCGVCGDFNNQLKADITGPRKCVYSKPELEVASYRIPEACPPMSEAIRTELSRENQQCAKYHIEPTKIAKSYKVSTGKCTLLRHLAIQRQDQICISKVPVTQCGPSCKSKPSEMVEKSVPFTCLPMGRLADHYLRKIQEGRPIEELSSMETAFSSQIRQPRHCVHALVHASRRY